MSNAATNQQHSNGLHNCTSSTAIAPQGNLSGQVTPPKNLKAALTKRGIWQREQTSSSTLGRIMGQGRERGKRSEFRMCRLRLQRHNYIIIQVRDDAH